jgi:hypothetical protein
VVSSLCKQRLFLGNGLENTFPHQQIHTTMQLLLNVGCFLCGPCQDRLYGTVRSTYLYNNRGAVFSAWSTPRSYLEDNWGDSVQLSSVQEAVRRRLVIIGVCNSVRLYSSCVKIRCQETASGDCNRLRTLICVSVIYEV